MYQIVKPGGQGSHSPVTVGADSFPPNGLLKGEIGKSRAVTGKEHHQPKERAVPGADPALKEWGSWLDLGPLLP